MLKYHLALASTPKVGYSFYRFIVEELAYRQLTIASLFTDKNLIIELCKNSKSDFNDIKNANLEQLQDIESDLKNVNWDHFDATIQWQESAENHIIVYDDPDYPNLLKTIYAPPPVLYAKGNIDLLKTIQFAIVGSRNPTKSGEQTAYDFAAYLSCAGMVITSGMALGIDAACHQACIDNHQPTIAVTGTGLDRIYPAKHKELAYQIADCGLLISEFALGTGPNKSNFPRRNQLISGLSVGTLVVEAALKSGSLITAKSALEQGREVFAIPGSIHNPLARGCHQLIKQGAKLVENAQDIIEEISPLLISAASLNLHQRNETKENSDAVKPEPNSLSNENLPCSDNQLAIFEFIDYEPISIDELCERCQLEINQVNAQLSILELEGKIKLYPDGRISL
ncbi:MAG: DNA-protecting protein DprA [Gammaproteobacteria bacterium]|nr:DNA-protecting protein DprA [Gammaproteobacteria bacterium]